MFGCKSYNKRLTESFSHPFDTLSNQPSEVSLVGGDGGSLSAMYQPRIQSSIGNKGRRKRAKRTITEEYEEESTRGTQHAMQRPRVSASTTVTEHGLSIDSRDRDGVAEEIDRAWNGCSIPGWRELKLQHGPAPSRSKCWFCLPRIKGTYAWDAYERLHSEFINSFLKHAAPVPAAQQVTELFAEMQKTQTKGSSSLRVNFQRTPLCDEEGEEATEKLTVIGVLDHMFFHNPSSDCKQLLYIWVNSQIDEYYVEEGLFEENTITGQIRINNQNLEKWHKHSTHSLLVFSKRNMTHRLHTETPVVNSMPMPEKTHTVPRVGFKGIAL